MVFSSTAFLFAFLPAVLALYFLVPARFREGRNLILLAFSLFFYFYGEPKGIFVMLLSIAINYAAAWLIDRPGARHRRLLLAAAVAVNLGILCYYKYTGFLLDNLMALTGAQWQVPDIVMPIGISFFTFQGMSYVFDVFFRTVPAQKNPLHVAMYISLFPQLVAGPIVRYETIAQEVLCRKETLGDAAEGMRRFVIGLAKKMLLANPMGQIAIDVFARSADSLGAPLAWVGALAFTFQIYFDFSGYSDMAIGLGRVFGFHFLENFNYPYIAASITDFWRRWHMSLSQWFRDYVYIPLGGNRCGKARQIFNITVVWALTGIWHGANWTFLIWGLYYAFWLLLEKTFLLKYLERSKVWSHVYTLLVVMLVWPLFQLNDIGLAGQYTSAMLGFGANGFIRSEDLYYLMTYGVTIVIAVIACTPLGKKLWHKLPNGFVRIAAPALILLALILSTAYLVDASYNPFLYFNF